MISIKQDSELMINYIPANPVAAGEHFVSIHDERSRPACFSMSSDKKLNLVIENDGAVVLTDFGAHIGITGDVQAFDAQQGNDLKLDICVAFVGDNSTSSFILIHQIRPRDLLNSISDVKIIKGSGLPTVHHLFMSNFSVAGSSSPPLVFAAFQPPDRITKTEDLGFLNITGSTAILDSSWSLSTNADKILDIAFGTCDLGDGVFVLYEASGKTKIQFKIIRGDSNDFVVEPKCPSGIKSIATFVDPKYKDTVLITGGKTLTYHFSDQYTSTKKDGAVMAESMDIKDIYITQARDELRVWYTTMASSVHYYTCTTSALSKGSITPILPPGRGGRISPLLGTKSSEGHISSFLSVDRTGNLTLSQQDPTSKIWQRYPYYHASAVNVTEIKGYTLRIQAATDSAAENVLIPYCWLRISSSGNIHCLVNGLEAELSRDGAWFRTGSDGTAHILIATTDASCHTLYVDCFCGGNSTPVSGSTIKVLNGVRLNPSTKLTAKLSSIKTGDDLLACRTQKGESVLGTNISREDANKAAAAIAMLVSQAEKADARDAHHFANHVSSLQRAQKNVNLANSQPLQLSVWDDIGDAASDAWGWVEDRGHDVVDWAAEVVDKVVDTAKDVVEEVVQLTVKIAGEVYTFVLKSVNTIAKGISWVLQQLGAAWEKVIDFLGFIFNWGDILTVTDNVLTMLNAGLDYGQLKIASLEDKAKAWIGGAKIHLKTALADVRKNQKTELGQASTSGLLSQDSGDSAAKDSVAFNWIGYQIQHGAVLTNAKLTPPSDVADTSEDIISEIWNDFTREFKVAADFLENSGKDFIDLLKSNSWGDVETVLAKFTDDLIDLIMDTLSNATSVILKVIRLGIASIKSLGNYNIECPIITDLWNLATGGRPLSLFNFFGLLIALPTTVLMKVTTGKKPPGLKSRLTGDTLGQLIEKGNVSGDSSLSSDIISVMVPALISTLFLSARVTALSLIWDSLSDVGGMGTSSSAVMKQSNVSLSVSKLSLASPVNPTVNFFAQAGAGRTVGLAASKTPLHENVFDVVALAFETGGLCFSWPPFHMNATYVQEADILRWSIWFLDLTNDAAIIITRAIGGVQDIARATTKRWRAVITMFTTLPKFGMEIAVVFNDYTIRGETVAALVRHIVEAVLDLAADLGFIAAAATDKIKGAEEVFWIGLAAFLGCASTRVGLKCVDYVLEHDSADK